MMEENKYSSEKQTHRRSKKTKTIDEIETLSSGETQCHIPQEIIQEILVRLPVKSLLRFKCVAKSWLALISSSKFIKIHLKYSTNLDPTLSNYRIMFSISPTDRYDVKCRSVSSVYCDFMSSDAVDVDFPSTQTNWVSSIVGSCDGLLCVGVYDLTRIHMFLWNPCLRMSKKLPLPITKVDEDELWECTYGIGYDVLNDDYKVVALFWDNLVVGYLVEIYSLKNDSWKRIENFKGRTDPSRSSMIYANGKLHFLAYLEDNDTSVGKTIVSLDLGNEVYGIVEHPEVDQPKYNKYHFILLSIEVLKGCISALYSYYAQDNKFAVDYADLWVLKEYGVKESWTKLARISRFHEYIGRYYESHILGILTNGKLLLGHGKCDGIFVYNPEDNSFIRPQICNLGPICSTGIYVESLVPLPT